MNQFQVGDHVIYLMTKQSSHPTLRATKVSPSAHGDQYNYVVEKFWVIREIRDDGTLVVQTRRGKTREILEDDPSLKKATWWHRWMYRDRFPELQAQPDYRDKVGA
ncbi:hypothetical protein [Rubinisphaera margarita]|uniref:hypothetical protein n=1 Tax=Rubinisphaera margarita TaxID=2909586 RepID=UPI001EE980BB|nr:hypothetical protein [Rubinisphaera margarita]MCG6157381.1 hypothetical protein [Rubinisphaera margarita]